VAIVDHIVYRTPDLDATAAQFTAATGVRPEPGGSHPGLGTRNEQVTLGGCYLELIGPDPAQPAPRAERLLGVDGDPGFVAIALRPAEGETLEDLVERAATVGFDLGPIVDMHRVRPDGVTLRWRLTMPDLERGPGVPFLIDWGATPQPSDTVRARAKLSALRIEVPEAERIGALHEALGTSVPVVPSGEPRLVVDVSGPEGTFDG
jgi:hypothetical protein